MLKLISTAAPRLLIVVSGLIALATIVLTVVTKNDGSPNNEIARSCSLVRSVDAAEWSATTDVPMRPRVPLEVLQAEPKAEKVSQPKVAASKKRDGKLVEISVFRGRKGETDDKPCVPKNEKINVCEEKARGNNICGTLLYPQKTVLYIESLGFCTVDDVTNRNHPKASKRVDWFLPANPADETSGEKEAKEIGHPKLMVYVISKPKPKAAKKKGRKK